MIRIKKECFLDTIILLIMILQIMVIRWANIQSVFGIIMIVLMIISLARSNHMHKKSTLLIFIIPAVYYALSYILFGGTIARLIRNFYTLLKAVILVMYICELMNYRKILLEEFFKKSFFIFNAFAIVNIPVSFMQIAGNYSLVGLRKIPVNTRSADYISGLFGLYGTPCMAAFVVFLILYNIYFLKYFTKETKYYVLIYTIAIAMFYCWLGNVNSTKGLYPMLLIAVVVNYFIKGSVNLYHSRNRSLKSVGMLLFVACLIICAYFFVQRFMGETMDKIMETIQFSINIFQRVYGSVTAAGGAERFTMIAYVITNSSHRWLGFGLGNYTYIGSYPFGFRHFGQADLGTFMIYGGIIYILILFGMLWYLVLQVFQRKWSTYLVIFDLIIMALYTQVFSDLSTSCSTAFLICIIWLTQQDAWNNRKNKSKR